MIAFAAAGAGLSVAQQQAGLVTVGTEEAVLFGGILGLAAQYLASRRG